MGNESLKKPNTSYSTPFHISSSETLGSRLTFVLICGFLLSQAYTIPLLVIGPSWAIWPMLSDIFLCLLFINSFSLLAKSFTSSFSKLVFRWLVAIFFVCLFSFLTLTISGWNFLGSNAPVVREGPSFGIFGLYRLAQAILIFWAVSKIHMTERRLRILGTLVTLVLAFVIVSTFLTFLKSSIRLLLLFISLRNMT